MLNARALNPLPSIRAGRGLNNKMRIYTRLVFSSSLFKVHAGSRAFGMHSWKSSYGLLSETVNGNVSDAFLRMSPFLSDKRITPPIEGEVRACPARRESRITQSKRGARSGRLQCHLMPNQYRCSGRCAHAGPPPLRSHSSNLKRINITWVKVIYQYSICFWYWDKCLHNAI